MNPPPTHRFRAWRRCLVALGACLTLIFLFYTEELWRGQHAWENCKRSLAAQGVKMDWTNFVPASVPDDENVFGVPQMQKWFVGRGSNELSRRWTYPGYGHEKTTRLILAELKIALPGTNAASSDGAAVLRWGDPQASRETSRLINDALGPTAAAPSGLLFMLRSREEVRPARIVLECLTAPGAKDLLALIPTPIANTVFPGTEHVQVDPDGNDSYQVSMIEPDTVADFLAWSAQIEPDASLMRQALLRPHARMNGNYDEPSDVPIPNFVCERAASQTLATMAQCHLLQGKPDDALRDLTLLNDLCRINQESQPMTMVAAMINAAVKGLYAQIIADGLRWRAWGEPQLAALEEQLRQIDILPPVWQSIEFESAAGFITLETMPLARVVALFRDPHQAVSWKDRETEFLCRLMPRGWVFQNMVLIAHRGQLAAPSLDSVNQIVFPGKLKPAEEEIQAASRGSSPFTFFANVFFPNYVKAVQRAAQNQTSLNETLIACALERYHQARAEYPDSLDALAPKFIAAFPHDVIGGQPLHYRRAADGTFLLYSVGWNERDDGGVVGKANTEGDWVWPISP